MIRWASIAIAWQVASGWSAEPPIVGRPADFTGAIGGPFVVTVKADRHKIAVEEPFTLTLRIDGPGNLKDIPRPVLAKMEAFKLFAVDDLDHEFREGPPPSRAFRYRLRARTAEANRIPPFKFVYFNPAIVPPSRGYQSTYAEAVPLEVVTSTSITDAPSDLPQRIAELRRRTTANPEDNEAWAALAQLRCAVRYPADHMRPHESRWPVRLTLKHNLAIALGLAVIAAAALLRWRTTRRQLELIAGIVAFAVAIMPAIGSLVQWRERARDEVAPVVVISRATELRRGNSDEYPARMDSKLPIGAEVRRLHARNGWLQVELENGVVGWAPANAIIQ